MFREVGGIFLGGGWTVVVVEATALSGQTRFSRLALFVSEFKQIFVSAADKKKL